MAGFDFTLGLSGEVGALTMLTLLTEELADMTVVWPSVRDALRLQMAAEFAAEGPGWAPLSEDYKMWKDLNFPGPILQLTGALLDSLTGGNEGDEIYEPSPMGMRWGTKIPYAWTLQHGDADINLPAREILSVEALSPTIMGVLTASTVWMEAM